MSVSRAGSGKGLPREPTKDATALPCSEPIGQLGAGNDPQLRGGVWDWHRGRATFSTGPKNVPARTHWVRLQPCAPGEAGGWHSPGLYRAVPPQSGSGPGSGNHAS